jgi:23S rRNA pseudouridine2605 synthase
MSKIRLQKFLSDCGICSRRKAEEAITLGYVKVNGEITKQLGTKIDPGKDIVHFKEKGVRRRAKHAYVMLNKPSGYTCTLATFKSEQNLSSLIPKIPHLYPVGRLDKDTEGLLLLTTDGNFAHKVMHPSNNCEKEYLVIAIGDIGENDIKKMQKGFALPDESKLAHIKSAAINKKETGRTYLSVILGEGQKRQIRRMFQFLGFTVQYLKRIRIGSVYLGSLPKGRTRPLTPKEITSLTSTSLTKNNS